MLSFDKTGFMEMWDPDTGAWPEGRKGNDKTTLGGAGGAAANSSLVENLERKRLHHR